MNPRKEATYRMLSLIAAVIFVLPCVFLVFPIFDINPDDLWQMDSLMEFICAYKKIPRFLQLSECFLKL